MQFETHSKIKSISKSPKLNSHGKIVKSKLIQIRIRIIFLTTDVLSMLSKYIFELLLIELESLSFDGPHKEVKRK